MTEGHNAKGCADAFQRLRADVRGATAIEYALIASGISIFILTGVSTLGSRIIVTFYDNLTSMF